VTPQLDNVRDFFGVLVANTF